MKFWKSLSNQIEESLPEWRDEFLSYKELKKQLKVILTKAEEKRNKRPRLADDRYEDNVITREEMVFILLLKKEIKKLNDFFVEKEEEYIIKHKEVQDLVAKAKESDGEQLRVRKEIVDFHGEMVLLENYSAINYTGLVKILKKYDKKTGALIRLPFIQKILQEPFFNTDLLYKFVKECEMMLDCLFPATHEPSLSRADEEEGEEPKPKSGNGRFELLGGKKELVEMEYMDSSLYMKSTVSALRVLKEIRSRSSTVSVFSLPPLQINV